MRIIVIRQPGIEFAGAAYSNNYHEIKRIETAQYAANEGLKVFFSLLLSQIKLEIYWNDVFCDLNLSDGTLIRVIFLPQDRAQIMFAPYISNKGKIKKKYRTEAKRFWKEIKHD